MSGIFFMSFMKSIEKAANFPGACIDKVKW